MSLVNVTNMAVLNNPSPFSSPLLFEITFECLQELTDDLEWKVLYVGSAESSEHDQVLDEILVGPVPVGINKFVLQADAPDRSCIPDSDLLGVTVLLVTCSYREQEFARVGYYVSNEYTVPYDAEVGPPKPLDVEKVQRTILADKPRVTRFPINWGDEQQEQQQTDTQQEQEQLNDDLIDENEEEEEEEEEDDESMDDDAEIDLDLDDMEPSHTQTQSLPNSTFQSPGKRQMISFRTPNLVTPGASGEEDGTHMEM